MSRTAKLVLSIITIAVAMKVSYTLGWNGTKVTWGLAFWAVVLLGTFYLAWRFALNRLRAGEEAMALISMLVVGGLAVWVFFTFGDGIRATSDRLYAILLVVLVAFNAAVATVNDPRLIEEQEEEAVV